MMKTLLVNRKITLSIFVVMLLIYGLQGVSYAQNAPDAVAEFSDRSLAIMVRISIAIESRKPPNLIELLNMSETDVLKIPKVELAKLISLIGGAGATDDLNLPQITELTGLEHATKLRNLTLWGQNVRDLTPLAQLTHLTRIDLSFNGFIDLTPLLQLTQLRELDVRSPGSRSVSITDLIPFAQFPNLVRIRARHFAGSASDIPLIKVSSSQSLVETNLNGSSVTLTLLPAGASYDVSTDSIRNALTVSGIDGVTVSDITRVSNTAVKVVLEFTGDFNNTQATFLTFTMETDAVLGYEGRTLTGSILVNPEPEETCPKGGPPLIALSEAPLTKATLDESVVTLTLCGDTYEPAISRIRPVVTLSGIDGVTIPWHDPDPESDTEITVKLEFDGTNFDTDSKLTFTVGADAIVGYNGPPLTAQISVSGGSVAQETVPTPTPTTEATSDAILSISPASVASPAIGEELTLSLNIAGGKAVAGYQAAVQFDTTALRFVSGANGDFLPAGAFFVQPTVDGNLVKLNAASLSDESNGDGTLATLTFEVIAAKASTLTLSDVLLSDSAGASSVPQVENARITEPTGLKGDINGDGMVNIQDLVLVASNLGKSGTNAADVNGDGTVNIVDLVLVAGALGTSAAAPSLHPDALEILTSSDVRQWLSQAQQLSLTDVTSRRGVVFLEQLLTALIPKETVLLANYPNPFNPETWIPYQLAKSTEVTLTLYGVDGRVVRTLALGHQPAGMYQSRSRAAYWDGKNAVGEPVASGIYFYTLTVGDFTATRKMLIRK